MIIIYNHFGPLMIQKLQSNNHALNLLSVEIVLESLHYVPKHKLEIFFRVNIFIEVHGRK